MRESIHVNKRGWKYISTLYDSLDEMADDAVRHQHQWYGGSSSHRFDKAVNYAHNGWDGGGSAVEQLDIIREAVKTSTGQLNMQTIRNPRYDVAGGAVDMGRFLVGDPECMVTYPMVTTSRVGKVIRLAASVDAYAGVSLHKRGLGLVALTEALTLCGHAVELYLDVFANKYQGSPRWGGQIRCLIKGANDSLDLSKVMFGYAYEDTMRTLGMACTHRWPEEAKRSQCIMAGSYGQIGNPTKDLPEGTLYIPHAMDGVDLDPNILVQTYLVQLGLAADPGNLPKFNIWGGEGYESNPDYDY
jgi:hypothetical protein